jgi:excinuclease ABC subunit C
MEAYDIAHLSGKDTVGVMVVMENGDLEKNEYRKFKIRGAGSVTVDDTKNLRELLTRRFGHTEWRLPNLIVIDGGVAQMNVAKEVLKERGLHIELVSVVKDEKHNAREIMGKKSAVQKYEKNILLLNSEAHRFAIAYHRNLRGKSFRSFR